MRKIHNFLISVGQIGSTAFFIVWTCLLIGWVINLFKLIGMRHTDTITTDLILRIIGIPLVPIGGIMGWL